MSVIKELLKLSRTQPPPITFNIFEGIEVCLIMSKADTGAMKANFISRVSKVEKRNSSINFIMLHYKS